MRVYNVRATKTEDFSAISNTKIIYGSTFVGCYEDLTVTCYSCATQAIAYRIQFSPTDDTNNFVTAGTGQTGTGIAIGSGGIPPVINTFTNNTWGWIRIEASALSACAINPQSTDLRFYIHGAMIRP